MIYIFCKKKKIKNCYIYKNKFFKKLKIIDYKFNFNFKLKLMKYILFYFIT